MRKAILKVTSLSSVTVRLCMPGERKPAAISSQPRDYTNCLKSSNSIQPKNKVSHQFSIILTHCYLSATDEIAMKTIYRCGHRYNFVFSVIINSICLVIISVNEMLQTAKLFARRGNSGFERATTLTNRQMNGLTFGEFCVLAADLKRFRTQSPFPTTSRKDSAYASFNGSSSSEQTSTAAAATTTKNGSKDELKPTDSNSTPEVFLGGSCNPTTWRADVAIPTLQQLGISFYNPVSVMFLFSSFWAFSSRQWIIIDLVCFDIFLL